MKNIFFIALTLPFMHTSTHCYDTVSGLITSALKKTVISKFTAVRAPAGYLVKEAYTIPGLRYKDNANLSTYHLKGLKGKVIKIEAFTEKTGHAIFHTDKHTVIITPNRDNHGNTIGLRSIDTYTRPHREGLQMADSLAKARDTSTLVSIFVKNGTYKPGAMTSDTETPLIIIKKDKMTHNATAHKKIISVK